MKELERPYLKMGSLEYREAEANLKSLEKKEEGLKISTLTKGELRRDIHKQALSEIRNIKEMEIARTGDFIKLKDRLSKYGSLDYKYMKATVFRENYEYAMEEAGFKNFPNYEVLKNKLDKFTNPISFYNFIKKSNVMMDIFIYYNPNDNVKYGEFKTPEERFNAGLEELELL